jgi:hypothetical protein
MSGDWQLVFECPQCGTQIAMGDEGGPEVTGKPPICEYGHTKTEMEQKLPAAFTPWDEPA